ncbi:MAG: hypothetical protein RL172_1985 [Bacteroidota bacterium]|jgi:hypothetical protein
MKKLTVVFAAVAACITLQCAGQADAPYKATYSSNLKIGDANYCSKVLQLWKDWDDNQLSRSAPLFADTIVMYSSDGSVTRGKKTTLDAAIKFRSGIASAKSVVHAFVPLHNNDNNDNVVCIWGTETDTFVDGRVQTRDLHEVWWFNKEGKVSVIRQWAAKFGTPN